MLLHLVFGPPDPDDLVCPWIVDGAADFDTRTLEQQLARAGGDVDSVEPIERVFLFVIEHDQPAVRQKSFDVNRRAGLRDIFHQLARLIAVIDEQLPAIGGAIGVDAHGRSARFAQQVEQRIGVAPARAGRHRAACGQVHTKDGGLITFRAGHAADHARIAVIADDRGDKIRPLILPSFLAGGENTRALGGEIDETSAPVVHAPRTAAKTHVGRKHLAGMECPANDERNAPVVRPADAAQLRVFVDAAGVDDAPCVEIDHPDRRGAVLVQRERHLVSVRRNRSVGDSGQPAERFNRQQCGGRGLRATMRSERAQRARYSDLGPRTHARSPMPLIAARCVGPGKSPSRAASGCASVRPRANGRRSAA